MDFSQSVLFLISLSSFNNFAFINIYLCTVSPSVFGRPLSRLPWGLLLNTWPTFLLLSILLTWTIHINRLVLTNESISQSPNRSVNSLSYRFLQFSLTLIPQNFLLKMFFQKQCSIFCSAGCHRSYNVLYVFIFSALNTGWFFSSGSSAYYCQLTFVIIFFLVWSQFIFICYNCPKICIVIHDFKITCTKLYICIFTVLYHHLQKIDNVLCIREGTFGRAAFWRKRVAAKQMPEISDKLLRHMGIKGRTLFKTGECFWRLFVGSMFAVQGKDGEHNPISWLVCRR